MKGTWAYALTLAVLLTGCGAKPDAPAPAPAETAAQTEAPETAATAAESTSAAAASVPDSTTAPMRITSAEREAVIAAYQEKLHDVYEEAMNDAVHSGTYALYDIDHNGIPELIMTRAGSDIPVYFYIYTYRDGEAKELLSTYGRVQCCYDTLSDEFVLMTSLSDADREISGDDYDLFRRICYISWKDIDENGQLTEPYGYASFEYRSNDMEQLASYMEHYHIRFLDEKESFQVQQFYEGELDDSLLENYPF